MVRTHNLGYPRIGSQRELKFALEAYWQGRSTAEDLEAVAWSIRKAHWHKQAGLDFVPVGDFSLYDHVLDMSATLGNLPSRATLAGGSPLDQYFRTARGRATAQDQGTAAAEMTKWFDTNYHYIVPEFSSSTAFSLHPERLLSHVEEARKLGVCPKPVLIGPMTYLFLGKSRDGSSKWQLLERLVPVYAELLEVLAQQGVSWVQMDEPMLVTDGAAQLGALFEQTYQRLASCGVSLLLTTYFGSLDHVPWVLSLPVAGLHLDGVRGRHNVQHVASALPEDKVLSVGIIDGRNVWRTDLHAALDLLEPLKERLGDRLWIAPSCSLIHVPLDVELETELDEELRSWLAFAVQKLDELQILAKALRWGRQATAQELAANAAAIASRCNSSRAHDPLVSERLAHVEPSWGKRRSPYPVRAQMQQDRLRLPLFPTTTIGSFPQTKEIRSIRHQLRNGTIDESTYTAAIKEHIRHVVQEQEALGLDVLVHGEPERSDMVEYFGEQLQGIAVTRNGWVQSYGSRCTKPPIIFGDVSRPHPMTVEWITFAQSLTGKPMKGILTGPVTILNWSFVRDDQPRATTCLQIALAIRDEVQDLERAGVPIIQIDEAALREGLPLHRNQWQEYLDWAITAYCLAANGVQDTTQIHTHMCYAEFGDIMEAIVAMDADVITIETSRSHMELLDVFEKFSYPNAIGPGVYDIHSPNVPSVESILALLHKAAQHIPPTRLWVNPDCGLKTRDWPETRASLRNMVQAAQILRQHYAGAC